MAEVEETVEDLMETGETGILENDPLGSIFGAPEAETVIETEVVTAPDNGEKVIEDEETVVTTEEPKEEPKVEKDPDAGWKAAYFAEKGKRQKLENEVQQPAEPTAFDWTNPEKTIETIKTDLRAESNRNFLNLSQAQCEARHEDFAEKYTVFVEMAKVNPAIAQAMLSKPDPAQWAYDQAAQKMFTDEVGQDPAAYREKIAAEERAKIEAELNKKAGDKKALADSLPPSAASLGDKVPTSGAQKEPFDALFPGQVAS